MLIDLIPSTKNAANRTGDGASITIQPSLSPIAGPQLRLVCLPYGATIKNSATKIAAASTNQLTSRILKNACSLIHHLPGCQDSRSPGTTAWYRRLYRAVVENCSPARRPLFDGSRSGCCT